jgi:hypothetical protein
VIEKKIKYDVQGGIRNYLGKQKTVSGVPLKWKSGPSHPETELAYITKAEKKLLIKKDLHKSLKDGPNKGPGGIMSLNNDGIGDLGGPGNVGAGGGYGDTGDFGSEKANDASLSAGNQSVGYGGDDGDPRTGGGVTTQGFFGKVVDKAKDYITGGGLIGMAARGLNKAFGGPKSKDTVEMYGPEGKQSGPMAPGRDITNVEERDGDGGRNLYFKTNQYPTTKTIPDEGIAALLNSMPQDPFVSRYLQSQPEEIRKNIEKNMQNYYTV